MTIQEAVNESEKYFRSGYNCAESVLLAVTEYFGLENSVIPRIATPFGGGISRSQHVCGAVTGGAMAIGLLYGRDDPKGNRARAEGITQAYIRWFESQYTDVNCRNVSGTDFSDPVQISNFRLPGGAHDKICVPLVMEATRYLCEMMERER